MNSPKPLGPKTLGRKTPDNVIPFPGETTAQIEAAATHWVAHLHSGECTNGDLIELAMWRAESRERNRVYLEVERLWNGLGALPRERPRRFSFVLPAYRRTRADTARGFAAIAAGIVAILCIGQYLTNWRHDYRTAPGQIRTVMLADGSVVSLKGGAAIDVAYTERGERLVRLVRGEAFFDVVHDPARPFIVDIGSARILDVGTGFLASNQDETGAVSVDYGAVQVVAAGRSAILTKGEGLNFGLYNLGRKGFVDVATASAWKRGLYFADAKPLGQVAADLGEYLPGKFLVVSDSLRDRRINAVVQLDHVDNWIAILSKMHGIAVRKIGPLIVIQKSGV